MQASGFFKYTVFPTRGPRSSMQNAKCKVFDTKAYFYYIEAAQTEAGQSEAQKAQGPDNINYH